MAVANPSGEALIASRDRPWPGVATKAGVEFPVHNEGLEPDLLIIQPHSAELVTLKARVSPDALPRRETLLVCEVQTRWDEWNTQTVTATLLWKPPSKSGPLHAKCWIRRSDRDPFDPRSISRETAL